MPKANEDPATPTEGPSPSFFDSDFKHVLECLNTDEEDVLSMCPRERSFADWWSGKPHEESSPMARRNKDCEDYRTLSHAALTAVGHGRKVRLLMQRKELLLIAKLNKLECDVRSLKEENAAYREEIREDTELIQCMKREMEVEQWEMEIEGVKLREAHKQDIQSAMRVNEALQEEIEDERELTRKVRKEMEVEITKLLEEHALEMRGPMNENEVLLEEIKEIRKLCSRIGMKAEDRVRQVRVDEEKLREAQDQEVRRLKRENERLQGLIEKERELIREDVRREMELKAHEIGIEERALREAQELGERVKTDADSLVARD